MIFQQFHTQDLHIEHWAIEPGQCWAVLGRNGSGKKLLAQALLDQQQLPEYRDLSFSLLSFEQQQAFYEQELKNDDSDFMDRLDPGTTVRTLLNASEQDMEALGFLKLNAILDRGYRLLSSGESRKALLAQALLQTPDYLILDEPYDSLDQQSKQELMAFFARLTEQQKTQLIFLLTDTNEISDFHSHVALLEQGELIAQGERRQIMQNQDIHALLDFDASRLPAWPQILDHAPRVNPLVDMKNARVSYAGRVIFDHINLYIAAGDHTLLTGPNGSGKSTLLHLITGDHPQSYGNDIKVLGFQRGTGESIWQLKKNIGIVSPELHRSHRVPGSALDIVSSGFFDTIGLYDDVQAWQTEHALQWLQMVGLQHRNKTAFKQLSYGEQRLVLIARALVKQPALLICDEPTQGLDRINRYRFLYFLEHLSSQHLTTVVMASHREDEHLSLFKQHLTLTL